MIRPAARCCFSFGAVLKQSPSRMSKPKIIRRLSDERDKTTQRSNLKTMVQKMQLTIEDDSSRSKGQGWDQLWQEGIIPWDLSAPTPALANELETSTWRYEKVLVPGCGSAFDLLTIAKHQQTLQRAGLVQNPVVVGLDISMKSLEYAKSVLDREYHPTAESPIISLVHGDFFDCKTWKSVYSSKAGIEDITNISSNFQKGQFDFIYDYVFFCALPPALRRDWGEAMSSLLKPGTGRLLTLMFPVLPNPVMKGPPFPVTVEAYREVLEKNDVWMESEPYESPDTVPERVGKELVCWWVHGKNPKSRI